MSELGQITLDSGWTIGLRELHQSLVYAGLFEGMPTVEMNRRSVERMVAEQRARRKHEPYLIAPVERPIQHDGKYPFGTPAVLPAIACVGEFHSDRLVYGNLEVDGSCLTVVWFQDAFAFPIDADVLATIRRIDWERLAKNDLY